MAANDNSAGLAGVVAGRTAVSTVEEEGAGLRYRGYDIAELAERADFEEVAHVLLYGEPPSRAALDAYSEKLRRLRQLPAPLREVLESMPGDAHPMDVLRTGCSFLGQLEPEQSFSAQHDVADRLLAALPSMVLYWHRFHSDGVRVDTATDADGLAGHFLQLLHGRAPADLQRETLDTSLTLYAEHEFNASTFTARVIAATLSDLYSAVTGAIGALRGPLHGGANEAAMALIERFSTAGEAEAGIREMLDRKELIMGFGHRVYRDADPRNAFNKRMARQLAEDSGDMSLYEVAEAIERVMWTEKRLFANADFYSAVVYRHLGIPTRLFTPIFVCARITGWCAHVFEQRADNRLIRPRAEYTGPSAREWPALDGRR